MFKRIRITIVAALIAVGCALGGVYNALPDTISVADSNDIAAAVCRRSHIGIGIGYSLDGNILRYARTGKDASAAYGDAALEAGADDFEQSLFPQK